MGQNSSVENCDRKKAKKIENTGSGLTILHTIVQRRGSTTKIKRHIHQKRENLDYIVAVKNKTRHVEENETIAELIRNSKKQNILKQQEKFLKRVMESKRNNRMSSHVFPNCDHTRYLSTPVDMNDDLSSKQNKSIKNWTIKDPNKSNIQLNPSIHTVYMNKNLNTVEENGDTHTKIIVRKNNQEKINELFKTLQSTTDDRMERDRNLYIKKKKTLTITHQNGVTILPSIEPDNKTVLKLHNQHLDSNRYHIDQLTKQHLDHKKYTHNNNNVQISNHKQTGFQNLLSELKCKISPSQQYAKISSTNCNIVKDNESINSLNWSTRSVHMSNDALYITDTSEIQNRFRTYSITESVASKIQKTCTMNKTNKNSANFSQVDSDAQNVDGINDERKVSSTKHKTSNSESVREKPSSEEKNISNQKRYRSVNNSKIYYYKTSPKSTASDFIEYPLPEIPKESNRVENANSSTDKTRSDSKSRKFTWVKDEENNWHKVII